MGKNSWFYSFSIGKQANGQTIKDLLTQWMIPKHLRGILRQRKRIFVDGHQVPVSFILQNSNTLTFELQVDDFDEVQNYQPNREVEVIPDSIEKDFVVVNKPAGMKMHPHSPREDDTLLNYLENYLIENRIKSRGQQAHAMMVHRLDRDTGGLVLVALNPLGVSIINRMIKTNRVRKTYVALVRNTLESIHGFIREPIGIDSQNHRLRTVDKNGLPAETEWWKIQEINKNSLIKIQLHTGRTHQIRVHFKSIGHPLIGDQLYDPSTSSIKRLMLHSQQIEMPKIFDNSGAAKTYQTPTPSVFLNA